VSNVLPKLLSPPDLLSTSELLSFRSQSSARMKVVLSLYYGNGDSKFIICVRVAGWLIGSWSKVDEMEYLHTWAAGE
jgi:hypothetical protein